MFVSVINFGHFPMLRFVGVKIFQSKSKPNSVILNWSCKLASKIFQNGSNLILSHPQNADLFVCLTNKKCGYEWRIEKQERLADIKKKDREKERKTKRQEERQ